MVVVDAMLVLVVIGTVAQVISAVCDVKNLRRDKGDPK